MTTESSPPPAKTPLYKNPFVWGLIIGIALLTALRPLQQLFISAPPPLLSVGEWSLTDHDGKPFGSRELEGKVWIADFFFTSCPSVCPELTRKMQQLEQRLADEEDVHLVSFTVDPETDTPEKLREYRNKYGITTSRWTFVTGTREQLHELIVGRMKIHVGERTTLQGELYDISHLARFALFDQNGDLRAISETDPPGLVQLKDAAELLVERGP